MNLSENDWKEVRKMAKRKDGLATTVYARMFLALSKGKGIRLSVDEVESVFGDDAVNTALWWAIPETDDVPRGQDGSFR